MSGNFGFCCAVRALRLTVSKRFEIGLLRNKRRPVFV